MRLAAMKIVPLAVLLAAVPPAPGQGRDPLELGDPAPGLDVESWIEGEEITLQPNGTYIVLFWEKPTGESTKAAVRLVQLYEQYAHRGLSIVAIAPADTDVPATFSERDPGGGGFAVGSDRRESTRRAWVKKAGVDRLPVAFIVGNGKVMHIGRPGDPDFESIVLDVLEDRYDPVLQEEAAPVLRQAKRARDLSNWRLAEKHYDEIIALDPRVFAPTALEKFDMRLTDMRDRAAAYEYARLLISDLFSDDGGALRMLAEKIATDPGIAEEDRDLDVALAAAERALAVEGGMSPRALSTLALLRFHRGELERAIELQTRAYFIARPEVKPRYKRALDRYREAALRSSGRIR